MTPLSARCSKRSWEKSSPASSVDMSSEPSPAFVFLYLFIVLIVLLYLFIVLIVLLYILLLDIYI